MRRWQRFWPYRGSLLIQRINRRSPVSAPCPVAKRNILITEDTAVLNTVGNTTNSSEKGNPMTDRELKGLRDLVFGLAVMGWVGLAILLIFMEIAKRL